MPRNIQVPADIQYPDSATLATDEAQHVFALVRPAKWKPKQYPKCWRTGFIVLQQLHNVQQARFKEQLSDGHTIDYETFSRLPVPFKRPNRVLLHITTSENGAGGQWLEISGALEKLGLLAALPHQHLPEVASGAAAASGSAGGKRSRQGAGHECDHEASLGQPPHMAAAAAAEAEAELVPGRHANAVHHSPSTATCDSQVDGQPTQQQASPSTEPTAATDSKTPGLCLPAKLGQADSAKCGPPPAKAPKRAMRAGLSDDESPVPSQREPQPAEYTVRVQLGRSEVLYRPVRRSGIPGGAAEVWLLQQKEPCPAAPPFLALKLVRPFGSRAIIDAEVAVLEQLQPHPNIVKLYGPWLGGAQWVHPTCRSQAGMLLEFCSGGNAVEFCERLMQEAASEAGLCGVAAGSLMGSDRDRVSSLHCQQEQQQQQTGARPADEQQDVGIQQQQQQRQMRLWQRPQHQQQPVVTGGRAGGTQVPAAAAGVSPPSTGPALLRQPTAGRTVLLHLRTLEQRLRVQFADLLMCLVKLHGNLGMAPPPAAAIYHRDILPQNLLVKAATGTFQLGDWGLGLVVTAEGLAGARPSASGTLHYMAPEQLTGQAATVGDLAKVDVWGLLVSWLQLLTGKDPWFWLGYEKEPLVAFWAARSSQRRLHAALDTHYGPLLPTDVTPALEFFKWALVVDVAARPTAAQVLAHPYVSSPRQRHQQ